MSAEEELAVMAEQFEKPVLQIQVARMLLRPKFKYLSGQ